MSSPETRDIERRGLYESIAVSVLLGVLALVWGLIVQSRVLVFDGVFILVGIGLTLLSLAAASAAASPPSKRFPYGLQAAAPLVIGFQGVALTGTLIFATFDAVMIIRDGGSYVSPEAVGLYGGLAMLGSILIAVRLGRLGRAGNSDIVAAEALHWRTSAGLSAVIAIGGVVGLLLEESRWQAAVSYVDPVLVIVACVLLAPVPVKMVHGSGLELLGASPPDRIQRLIDLAIAEVRSTYDLPEPAVAATKLGRRLFVEVGFLVPDDWRVADEDAVRRDLSARLIEIPLDVWALIELTTDESLLE